MTHNIRTTHTLSPCGQFWEMRPEIAAVYRECLESQLQDWLRGVDRHTRDLPEGIRDECTPDMACCGSKPWTMEMRKQFTAASREDRSAMLRTVLTQLVARTPGKVLEPDPKRH